MRGDAARCRVDGDVPYRWFDAPTSLRTDHLGRSAGHPTFSIPAATENTFKKSVYELTPWPTSLGLDPRYVSSCLLPFFYFFLLLALSLLGWQLSAEVKLIRPVLAPFCCIQTVAHLFLVACRA